MKKFLKLLLIVCILTIISCAGTDVIQEDTHTVDIDKYIDFSYAGYEYSEKPIPEMEDLKVFDVTDYGAIPDDDKSDEEGISRAIEAAVENGSGIVYLPKGRYLVNTDEETRDFDIGDYESFRMESPFNFDFSKGNIIIRGEKNARAEEGGTEVHMVNPLGTETPEKMYTPPFLFDLKGADEIYTVLGRPKSDAKQGEYKIRVSNVDRFEVGMWISLSLNESDPELLAEELHNKTPEKSWKAILKEVRKRERHEIAEVDPESQTITFREPLKSDVNKEHNWRIQEYAQASHVGVENIWFSGSQDEFLEADNDGVFKHHKNFVVDSGWQFLRVSNVTDSWIQDCTFEDFSRAVSLRNSARVSIVNLKTVGAPAHACITVYNSMGVLVAGVDEQASAWHAAGVQGVSVGNVFWRNRYPEDVAFESHASQPRYTLFDNVEGGLQPGHFGGARDKLPNHLTGLTLWNFKQTNQPDGRMDFWQQGDRSNKVVSPVIVGLHGTPSKLYDEQIAENISWGTPVDPESLFESQLIRRLGELPKHLKEIKDESTNKKDL